LAKTGEAIPPWGVPASVGKSRCSSNSRYELVWLDIELRPDKDEAINHVFGQT
jgi:hypothetical protein